MALLRSAKALEKLSDESRRTTEFKLSGALSRALRRIAQNAGVDGAVVAGRVQSMKGAKGFNAGSGEFEDLIEAGIIDPTKVVRTALQNAASISGLLLTTDAAVTEAPEPKKAAPPMPGGGDDYDY